MYASALALLIALAGPSDTVRIATDSVPIAGSERLEFPLSLQLVQDAAPLVQDTVPRKRVSSVEVSEWYERRLRIHRYGAYTMIPLFALQAVAGSQLYSEGKAAPGWAKTGHRVGATGLAAVFGLNTVTGLWNLWDSRAVPQGRKRRAAHALLMLASDAGFTYAGIRLSNQAENNPDKRRQHRNLAIASMTSALAGVGVMVFGGKD